MSTILTYLMCVLRLEPDLKITKEGEFKMIELTDSAKEQIDGYFQGKEPTPVRIFLNSGG